MHEILGAPIGNKFYKKYLVKKEANLDKNILSNVPVNFKNFPVFEQINIIEDYIEN